MKPRTHRSPLGLLLLALAASFSEGRAQELGEIRVLAAAGPLDPGIEVVSPRGFASFRARDLTRLGWSMEVEGGKILARWPEGGVEVEIREGTPFLRWGSEGVHLAHAPFSRDSELHLPVQFLVDILPWKLPLTFRWDPASGTLELLASGAGDPTPDPVASARTGAPGGRARSGRSDPPPDPVRVVVIDAGHGGRDPGARGPGGTQEKDVALAIAEALAELLRGDPKLEVHLTRQEDELIPLWQRGELATGWKEDRHGVFISIHANALPNARSTRGFETYFLSEARTEHERRVAALENSAMELEDRGGGQGSNPDLSFILTELRNLDHQHWSALLAEMVQGEIARVHPGPNRGVKQGPLAVITNALMPSVLLEVGFITNPEEERLLGRESFQEDVAKAVAAAVREFFRRYPPQGTAPSWAPGGGAS